MKELTKKMDDFNKKYTLSQEQREVHGQVLQKLVGEHPEIAKLDAEQEEAKLSGQAFNKVGAWYAGNKEGLPLSINAIFYELLTMNIFVRGNTKEENVERYNACFDQVSGCEVKEFTDFQKKLIKELDGKLNELERLGAASIELSFKALDICEKEHGIKPMSREEFEARARNNALAEQRNKKKKRK